MSRLGLRLGASPRLSAISRGLSALKALGDRATVLLPGAPTTVALDAPLGSFFVPSGYDNTLTESGGGFYTNTGTAGQTRACMTLSCETNQQYTLSFNNNSGQSISVFIREGSDGYGTIVTSATLPVGQTSISWTATMPGMVVLWNFNPPQPITVTSVRLQKLMQVTAVSGTATDPKGGIQVIGPELVTNGDFSNGLTGYTLWQPTSGVVQAEAGGARIRTNDATFAAIQPVGLYLSPGSTYRITFSISNWTAGRVQVSVDGSTAAFNSGQAVGTYTADILASGAGVLQIKRYGGENCDLIVDDLSCKQITTVPLLQWLEAYVESTANTVATVDGPVGFMSDANAVLGPELAPQSLLSWSQYNTPTSVTANTVSADALADGLFFNGLIVGQQYQITVQGTATVSITYQQYGGSTIYQTGFGTSVFIAQEPRLLLRFAGAGTATYFKLSVKQLTGKHATQTTAANKPTLVRGLKNIVPYSSDFTNAAWGKGAGINAITPGQPDPYGGTLATRLTPIQGQGCYLAQTVALQNSTVYTRVAIVKPDPSPIFAMEFVDNGAYSNVVFNTSTLSVSGSGAAGASVIPMPNGWFICMRTWTTGATGTQSANAWYVNNYGAATSTDSMILHRFATLIGVVSAAAILQLGLPLTTATASSGSNGNYALSYNGTSSSLSLALPYTISEDHLVIQGLCSRDISNTRPSYTAYNSNSRYPVLYVGSTGLPTASWRDDTGAGPTLNFSAVPNGENFVLSAQKVGSNVYVRKNGGGTLTSTLAGMGTTTVTALVIGSSPPSAGYWLGEIYPTVIVKGTISAALVAILERFVGALTGQIGVKF